MKRGTMVMSGIRRGAVTPPGSPFFSSSRPLIDEPTDVMARQTEPAEGLQSSSALSLASTLPVIPGRSTTTSRKLIRGIDARDCRQGRRDEARENTCGRDSAAPHASHASAGGESAATQSRASVYV